MNAAPDRPPSYPLGHPDGQSPDVDRLAVDTADPDSRASEVTAHLAGCTDCRTVVAALDAVRTELRAQTAPMPAAVSRRIAAALRDEGSVAPTGQGATDVAAAGRHRSHDPDDVATAWRPRLRFLAAVAAGVIVVGGGGFLVVDRIGTGGGSDGSTSSDAGADDDTVFGAPQDADPPAYDRASLRAAVGDLLATDGATDGGGIETQSAGGATAVEPDCLASLPVATGAALSITRAVYDGQPAIIVLFAGSPGRVQVTVLTDCTEGEPQVLDEFEAYR